MKYVRGFTLIELLVVISIIGMLSSIVIASTQETRERGRITGGIVFATHVHRGYGDRALGFWSLDETQTDSSGNNRSAILVGNPLPSYSTDRYIGAGKSLSLNNPTPGGSASQYVRFTGGNSSVFSTKDITLSAWIKTSTNQTEDYQIIISLFPYYGMALCSGGYLAAYGGGSPWSDNDVCPPIQSSQSLTDGKWHQITMTTKIGATNATVLYIDGRIAKTETLLDTGTYNSSDIGELSVGAKRWGSSSASHGYTGLIANVGIYPAALTTAEVERLYAKESRERELAGIQ